MSISKERLKPLTDKYPDYSDTIDRIAEWFEKNSEKNDISISELFEIKNLDLEKLDIVLYLFKKHGIFEQVYRILDDEGLKMGEDYKSLEEIPEEIENQWGQFYESDKKSATPFFIVK